jgi:hypothetical protein
MDWRISGDIWCGSGWSQTADSSVMINIPVLECKFEAMNESGAKMYKRVCFVSTEEIA